MEIILRSVLPPFYSLSLVEKVCKRRLSRRPGDRKAIWILSNFYIWHGKNQEAKEKLEHLIKLGIARNADKLLLSKAYYRLGLHNKVVEILDNNNILNDKSIENCYMGSSLVELNEFKKATEYLERFLRNHKTKDFLVFAKLGYAYYMDGSYDHALKMYQQAGKLNPTEEGIKENIRLCIDKLGDNNVVSH